jgi:integrase
VKLRDAGLSEKTQQRYYLGLRRLVPTLLKSTSLADMDERAADWVQERWEKGDSQHRVSDALCAMHHFEPWVRGKLPQAWKLFAVWRKLESPDRAPPLVLDIIYAWTFYAIDHFNWDFAAMILLGFFALLRTGECLQVAARDLLIGENSAVVSLSNTKTSLRHAAKEMVSFEDPIALGILREVCHRKKQAQLDRVPIWTKSAQAFRNDFAHHCRRFDLLRHKFRPYSLRRGGATFLFQTTGSMETALLKGRWQSSRVARIYLADGLSCLPHLTFSSKATEMLKQWGPFNQL